MRKRTRKSLKRQADQLFCKYIRKDGFCERCGKSDKQVKLDCAHIFSRRFLATRFSPLNACALCVACHRWAHDRPIEFTEWIKEYLGDKAYEELKEESRHLKKLRDYELQEIVDDLKEKLDSDIK